MKTTTKKQGPTRVIYNNMFPFQVEFENYLPFNGVNSVISYCYGVNKALEERPDLLDAIGAINTHRQELQTILNNTPKVYWGRPITHQESNVNSQWRKYRKFLWTEILNKNLADLQD